MWLSYRTSAAAAAAPRASLPPSPVLPPNVLPGALATGTDALAPLVALVGAAGRAGGASPSVRP